MDFGRSYPTALSRTIRRTSYFPAGISRAIRVAELRLKTVTQTVAIHEDEERPGE
jgi:hypothetical protein